jgi:hypothetical protein
MEVLVGEEHTTLVNSDLPDHVAYHLMHCHVFG